MLRIEYHDGRRDAAAPQWRTAATPIVVALLVGQLPLIAGRPFWADHAVLAVLTVLMAALLAAAGAVLMLGGGSRKTGVALIIAALLYSAAWAGAWNRGWWPLIGEYTQSVFFIVLGVGILLHGRPRFAGRLEWAWTWLAVVVLIGAQTSSVLVVRPEQIGYAADVVWPDLRVSRSVADGWLLVAAVSYAVLAICFVAVLVVRRRDLPRLDRHRSLPLVVVSGVFAVASAVVQYPVTEVGTSFEGTMLARGAQGAMAVIVPLALFASAVRARWSEEMLAVQLNRLIGPPTPQSVEAGLRTVLQDPTLRIWYWLPEIRLYVAGEGDIRFAPPSDDRGLVEFRVTGSAEPLVQCELDPAVLTHANLVRAALAACVSALQANQLQLVAIERLRADQYRLVEAERDGRRKLARNLHDGVQQLLVALKFDLARIARLSDPDAVREQIAESGERVQSIIADVRNIAHGAQAPSLLDQGLAGALEVLAERHHLPLALSLGVTELPGDLERELFYVLSEALTNVVMHAQASSVRVGLRSEGDTVVAEVVDDGIGGAVVRDGHGLRGISERVRALRGHLEIDSRAGGGTRLTVVLPRTEETT
ncbi:sensor histidine kinase [Dactylosporangium vinaceum]|uniref:histidine kinase n=1 Tax=Dactylosporangium vinaceum TaxID=53362 RepID=A0ABV5M5H1_9ACTN|nr:sensor histidine kinase [Dactylosporangium vinaceum]UAB95549.1 sensor histidine kinase [Dactylosporangium vinaceum]